MSDFPMLRLAVEDGAISFARTFVKSEAFMQLFREGMGLVELTANYLDGDGRSESAALPREVSLVYATESMRLTTRLMQIASWLLVQRAVAEGEMTAEQARAEKNKVRIAEPMLQPTSAEAARLPLRLRELIAHSIRLQERIGHLENQMSQASVPVAAVNPVRGQLANLQARLGALA
jgi:regulator of CtrA degradation